MRNILKALHVCNNGGFQPLAVLPFIFDDDLTRRATVVNYYSSSYKGL